MAKKTVLEPINDKIWVEREEEGDNWQKAEGSVIFTGAVQANDNISKGTVVAVGTGRIVNAVVIPFSVKVGDRVAFTRRSVTEIVEKGKVFVLVKESDIHTIIKEVDE